MPTYKALERCYIADVVREPGDEFEYEFDGGKAPAHVEEVKEPAAPSDTGRRANTRSP